ncbi:MAG: NAD-dependent dehydratase [Rubrivivax sp. SCN 70-15]|nr:MAG: NAD-dependent dehydratase [Rubrivivax sp. SCN 70-15]
MNDTIVVLGGTGFVGRALCERLVERSQGGGRVVVPTRRLAHGVALRPLPTLELVEADVHDAAALTRLIAGADAVVNLVAILHGSAARFQRVHVELPRTVARACAAAGVRRLVQVSALGVGPQAPSNYLRSKTEGEAVLQAQAQAGRLALTLLRPSVIFGAEDRFLNTFAALQALAPLIPLAGSHAHFQPVWVDDVATAIAACLDRPQSIGKTYELVGPKVYTLSELVRLAGRWSGHERPQIALPEFAARLQALAMECLPGEPLMSRDNVASMRVPNVASGQLPGLEALGIRATALDAVAPGYLGAVSGRARLERLRASAGRG